MNNHDRLLEWASETGGGTWERWKNVCGVLKLEPNQAARALSALGHVEFDWVSNRFNCAPAVAVLTLHSSGCVLLTGARRRAQRTHLEQLYQDERFNIDLLPPVPQRQGPETWLVEAELGDVQRFCVAARMRFEIDSGRRIAEVMPTATLERVGERDSRPDPRFPRRWFDPHRRVFLPEAPRGGSEGLWWVEDYRRETAFVYRGGEWFRVPVREYGPYVAHPGVSFLTYEKATSTLAVDNRASLPPLLARAATLQSGRLPLPHGTGRHAYVNIDEELAKLIRDRLNTPIRGIDDDA